MSGDNKGNLNGFCVVPFGNGRYAIEKNGIIVDDAQGYGYKTKRSAYKFIYYKTNRHSMEKENRLVVSFMRNNKFFSVLLKPCCLTVFVVVKDLLLLI